MVKYLNFLIGDQGKKDVYDGILKRSSLEEMWRPQLPTVVDANGNRGFTTDIGLIFFINRMPQQTLIGHGGDQNGFLSYLDFDPQRRTASVLVVNTTVNLPDNSPPEADVMTRLRREIVKLHQVTR
jgi:CubicO group peptidase (beta-lactamase class C family)